MIDSVINYLRILHVIYNHQSQDTYEPYNLIQKGRG